MSKWKYHGKDKAPTETIQIIKAILNDIGFEPSCKLVSPEIGTCYYSLVTAGGFFSNGKGFSPELCEASGYAELMERLQNKRLSTSLQHFDDYFSYQKKCFPCTHDVRNTHPCVNTIFSKLAESAIDTDGDLAKAENFVNQLLTTVSTDGRFVLREFYSVKSREKLLLPVDFLQLFTGTNGMAAGNSLEEAVVQSLCEILERYAAIQILTKGLTPPEIPKSFLKKYKLVSDAIEQIETNPSYSVSVLDASLGVNIPCVICVIKNLKTQTFGIKFGAYPDMEIALERCLTEAFQGQNLESFSRSGTINFSPFSRYQWQNILNLLKISRGYFPSSLFVGQPSWQYHCWPAAHTIDNKKFMRHLFDIVEQLGSEIFIQDVSFLGFPTVYIYIPGISEIAPTDALWLEEQALARKIQYILTDLKNAKEDDVEALYSFAKLKRGSFLENSFRHISHIAFDVPCRDVGDEMGFLAFLCAHYLQKNAEARKILYTLPKTEYINAVRLYFAGIDGGISVEENAKILYSLCNEKTAAQVLDDFKIREAVLTTILPQCCGDCTICDVRCSQKTIRANYRKILECELNANIGSEGVQSMVI